MMRTELPIPRAFRALQDVVYPLRINETEALTFTLTWVAAARMVQAGHVSGLSKPDDLNTEQAWTAVEQAGLPVHGFKRWLAFGGKDSVNLLAKASLAVKELVSDLGNQSWDVLPTLTSAAMSSRRNGEGMLCAEVAELMLDMLGQPVGALWIPFDHWGVLAIRALRRGWRVKAASMLAYVESVLPLLLAIEYGQPSTPMLDAEVERDREGRPLTKADFILATPPFGSPVRDTKLAQWDSSEGNKLEQYVRSEAWAVHELVNRASQKAVFLLPPSILFSRGQEQRLREYLLNRGGECNELQSVVTLPGRALSATHIATALVAMTPGRDNTDVLMVDLGLTRRSLGDIDELVRANREVALGRGQDDERACRVSREDIWATEVSFTPSRYLRKKVEVGPNAEPLEAICNLVRVPMFYREDDAVERLELGIADIGGWNAVHSGLEKVARLHPRRDLPTLQEGDVVLSVKGTIGKACLVGAVQPESVVVSQNCLGLRVKPNRRNLVSPQYLLMYLRSEAGQAQLQSLQDGANTQHISSQTLSSSFLVPVPEAQERAAVENDYLRLCQLEREIADIQQQMKDISLVRWVA